MADRRGHIVQQKKGAVDVPVEPGSEEQMAHRHAVAPGKDENQHEESRMRDPHW